MGKEILHIDNLSKSFGGLKLFDGVNIALQQGTINSLFGGNGSGKTTFFNLIGGYEKPDAGIIHFNGLRIKFHDESVIARAGIGRMWQDPSVFPNHTVLQNLLVSAKTHPGEYFLNYVFNRTSIKRKEVELKEKAIFSPRLLRNLYFLGIWIFHPPISRQATRTCSGEDGQPKLFEQARDLLQSFSAGVYSGK